MALRLAVRTGKLLLSNYLSFLSLHQGGKRPESPEELLPELTLRSDENGPRDGLW